MRYHQSSIPDNSIFRKVLARGQTLDLHPQRLERRLLLKNIQLEIHNERECCVATLYASVTLTSSIFFDHLFKVCNVPILNNKSTLLKLFYY